MFSHAVGTEDNCRQISLTCVESTCSVPVCPHSRHVCFPPLHCSGSRLLYGEWALGCVHFPGPSHEVRFRFLGTAQRPRLNWACVLCLPIRAAQGTRRLKSALSLGALHLIPSAVWPQLLCALVGCALCLFWESDFWLQPSWWMSTIQNLRKS